MGMAGMNCKWIIWFVLVGWTSIQTRAQAVHAQAQDEFLDDLLCPIEWVNQIAELEGSRPADFPVHPRPGMPIHPVDRARNRFGFQTDALANVYLRDPKDIHPTEVTLEGLFGDGTRLEGLYVRSGSERLDGFFNAAAGANGADYRFPPDTSVALPCNTDLLACSRFDAVNAYYHVDQFARRFWVERMGLPIAFQADVKVHVGGDGAFASSEGNVLKFRLGDIFMKNAALSDDLIYHEYAHLVAANLGFNPLSNQSAQTRAMSEGYADYFTATYTDDPRIGEWVVTCPDRQACVGADNDKEIRTLALDPGIWNWKFGFPNGDLQYGFCLRYHPLDGKCKASFNNFADHYVWGMIWAATFWDLRIQLGADVVDRLAVAALQLHSSGTEFSEATGHVLQADMQAFGGLHVSTIREAFRLRGFIVPIVESLGSSAEIPILNLEIWPSPALKSVHASFETIDPAPWTIALFDILGREVKKRHYPPGFVGSRYETVDIEGLPSGTYIFSITIGSRTVSRPFSVIH